MTPPTASPHRIAPELEADAARALDLLFDPALEPVVDMVVMSHGDHYEARTHDGTVTFRRSDSDQTGYEQIGNTGVDPLADQSSAKFAPLANELANAYPHRSTNAYPHAYDTIAQLFDHPSAPDLCVIHSAAHNWEEIGRAHV